MTRLRNTENPPLTEPLRERPAPWGLEPEGYHFEVAPAGDEWIIPPRGAGRCRFGRPSCKRPAVVSLMRGYGDLKKPWDYCEEHLYGRWIEDGQVVGWRLVKDDLALPESWRDA